MHGVRRARQGSARKYGAGISWLVIGTALLLAQAWAMMAATASSHAPGPARIGAGARAPVPPGARLALSGAQKTLPPEWEDVILPERGDPSGGDASSAPGEPSPWIASREGAWRLPEGLERDVSTGLAAPVGRALDKVAQLIRANAGVQGTPHWRTWRATFYCDQGLTASGKWAGPGTIASGPELPFGTLVHLPGWGTLSVEDRGGVIWDGRIDIWVSSCSDALQLGVQVLSGWYIGG